MRPVESLADRIPEYRLRYTDRAATLDRVAALLQLLNQLVRCVRFHQ